MKHVLFVIDGVADHSLSELNGQTPLEAANAPTLNVICANGIVGTAVTIPQGAPAGTDSALLTVFGCDVLPGPMSRAHLEAAGFGIIVPEGSSGLRMNLATVEDGIMRSHCGSDITNNEAQVLVKAINDDEKLSKAMEAMGYKLYLGEGFRHILTITGDAFAAMPPHEIIGQPVAPYLQTGADGEMLAMMSEFMDKHEVNDIRRGKGLGAANFAWPWGGGKRPNVPDFAQTYGIKGCAIGAVPIARGIGTLAGLFAPEIPGTTGGMDTDYHAKAATALKLLSSGYDFAFVHFEATDESAHAGNAHEKVEAIHIADKLAKELLDGLVKMGDFSIMLLSDHYTSTITRGHLADPPPFCLMRSGKTGSGQAFTEHNANGSGIAVHGKDLLQMLIKS